MGRTRVLHVTWNFEYGGLERLVCDIARTIDHAAFETHVLTFGRFGPLGDALREHATLHVAVPQERWSMLAPRALAAQIAAIAPDVVHSHSGVWFKTSLAARRAGVRRVVHTDHGRRSPDPWQDRAIDRLASRRTDAVVAVSEKLERQLRDIVVDPRRVIRVINGVDTTTFAPGGVSPLRRELGIAEDAPVIGSIGRLEPIKGYEVMVAAFARLLALRTDGPTPTLVIAGDGSCRADLEAQAASLGVREHVRFLGWRTDGVDCHRLFDVFTLTSHSEGTSISLLEAMSCGTCPVVTDVGGNAAVLGADLAHRLAPAAAPDAIAAAWAVALDDIEARRRDGRVARARVERDFSIRHTTECYEHLYTGPHGAPVPACESHTSSPQRV